MGNIEGSSSRPATRKQLRYLRVLADQTGTTFVPPVDVGHASDQIERLQKLLPTNQADARREHADARREKRQVQDDLATRPHDSVAFRSDETSGYGSTARWNRNLGGPRVYSRRIGAPTPPPGAVYVGRPTIYGNPFPIGPDGREACVARYAQWLREPQQAGLRDRAIDELRGRDLVCWCAPQACHADVLLDLANPDA